MRPSFSIQPGVAKFRGWTGGAGAAPSKAGTGGPGTMRTAVIPLVWRLAKEWLLVAGPGLGKWWIEESFCTELRELL